MNRGVGDGNAPPRERDWFREELARRDEELGRLRRELEDTNRGVMALYAELDDRAERLQRANKLKSQFLSHMSHEFRTPLSSILALARLLEDRVDGALTAEQERQVGLIRKAAEDLSELVNDLLDLARVEAGMVVVRPGEVRIADLFGALRGMIRPLLAGDGVRLSFDEAEGMPPLHTDEAKVAQILRNFLSNAVKFTERGEIRVSAAPSADGTGVVISVADTGVGIAPADHARVFEEFGQIEGALQRRVKGTGLGLALSRKLAEVLGGTITLDSATGVGSTFSLHLPVVYAAKAAAANAPVSAARARALVVDDEEAARYVLRARLAAMPFVTLEATGAEEALRLARDEAPDVVLLDLRLGGESGLDVLDALRTDPRTRDIPVLAVTAAVLSDEERGRLASRRVPVLSKQALSQPHAEVVLREAMARAGWHARAAAAVGPAGPP